MGNAWAAYTDPEGTPHPLKGPSFDPMYGFPNGRKERGKGFLTCFTHVVGYRLLTLCTQNLNFYSSVFISQEREDFINKQPLDHIYYVAMHKLRCDGL